MRKKLIICIFFCILMLLPIFTFANSKATITVEYSYNKTKNTVLATVKSDVQLKDTKISWKLSNDKLTYTYEFKENTTYTTTFEDINGNKIPVPINVTRNR